MGGFTRAGRTLRTRLAVIATSFAAAVGIVAVPQALNPAEADAQTRCPAVVVLAARGSGQNTQVYPTWYSNQAAWASNGWEGETIRAFLRTAESRYAATHNGASLMKDVHVLGLSPNYYPATFPEYEVPNIAQPNTLGAVLSIAATYGAPVINTAISAATQFVYSVNAGRGGVMDAVNDYERASGCRPSYIPVGFSQGAMILAEHERELARRGQLAGVIYMGNPMTAPRDRHTVGVPGGGAGGILGLFPNNTRDGAATGNRVNYCLPLDGVCDLSVATLEGSRANGGNHGRYFLRHSRWDNQVADSFGRFVDQVRYR